MSKPKDESSDHDDEKLRRDGEEPGPLKTIVGGRPDNREKMINGLPSGIQRLIISASMNDAIKASVIQNPVKAAKDLEIELSDSESAILSSVPSKQMINMIESMENNPNIHRRDFLFESAAALAAAAASALGVNAYAAQYPATQGIPATRGHDSDVPSIAWYQSLDLAFNNAKRYKKPLLAVFLHNRDFKEKHPPTKAEADSESIFKLNEAGRRKENFQEIHLPTEAEVNSESIFKRNEADLRKEIFRYRLIPARIEDEKIAAGYKITVFPTVIIFSPDGEELGKVLQPKNVLEISEALQKAMATYEKMKK